MKRIISLMAALILSVLLCVPAMAAGAQLDYVTDAAMLLTDEEWETLEDRARAISEQYDCGVYIVTLEDFTWYVDTYDPYEAAKAIYREYDLGLGGDNSGVLLMLSMAERDYALISYGYGNTAFTDYGKDVLADAFLDDLSYDDWYGGFEDYLAKSESLLRSAEEGHPLDVGTSAKVWLVGMLISVGLGCLLAMLVCWTLRQRMRSVSAGAEADAYIHAGSVDITLREDRFTHATESRVKIEKKSGGTTVDSSGFSGKKGKF